MADVELSPFHRWDFSLAGVVVSGRWPDTTREWVQLMTLIVRLAAVPGVVPHSEIFRATEELEDEPVPGAVGLIIDHQPAMAAVTTPSPVTAPPAILVIHPPDLTQSAHGFDEAASGALLLPGIPGIGLSHRAVWVQVQADGTVARLVTADGVDPVSDPDIAVLSSLLAA
jgi:hypothetical protein